MDTLNLDLLAREFHDEDAARSLLETLRWPNGIACPHCGGLEPYRLKARPDSKSPGRPGLMKCRACRKQFTVRVGTIFEGSKVPLTKWLLAVHLLSASKKGISAHQLHRSLGVDYNTAWFMAHRLRYAMAHESFEAPLDGIVEVDTTFVGGKPRYNKANPAPRTKSGRRKTGPRPKTDPDAKTRVLSLVERGGRVRSFVADSRVTPRTLNSFVLEAVSKSATIMSDEDPGLRGLAAHFDGGHHRVNHSKKEYSRDGWITTNTIEGFFSIFKRGVYGTFHHISRKHMHRYLAEFDFRYSARKVTDGRRMVLMLAATEGKRLKLHGTAEAPGVR